MTNRSSLRWMMRAAARIAITTAVVGACSKDSSNTAPLVGTSIVANAATNAQATAAGTATPQPVSVVVTDQNGNPIQNVSVTWTVVNHAGTTSASSSTTDATGTATVTWTVDTIARVDSMTASIFAGASVTITATGTAGPAANVTKVSGDAQTDSSTTTSAPFVIKVTDRYGNAVQGAVVGWVVTGGGTLSAASTTTDATGSTQTTLTLGATPGPYVITATAGVLAAVTFNLTGT